MFQCDFINVCMRSNFSHNNHSDLGKVGLPYLFGYKIRFFRLQADRKINKSV